ncbi:hypothetical protein D6Z43_18135 [Pseudomonas sp. DY-1]|nr:hypothetical protein D6Z43_18135 [Pseudomonas sp. DY-1]
MRRIFCRRFEGSISLGNPALSRKSDRGIAESVKPVANGQAGFGWGVSKALAPACVSEFIRDCTSKACPWSNKGCCAALSRMNSLLQECIS